MSSKVQAGGGLVQHVDRAPGGTPLQFRGELDPLGLTAGQGGRGLPEPDIAQADVDQRLQVPVDGGTGSKNSAASSIGMSSTSAMVLPL